MKDHVEDRLKYGTSGFGRGQLAMFNGVLYYVADCVYHLKEYAGGNEVKCVFGELQVPTAKRLDKELAKAREKLDAANTALDIAEKKCTEAQIEAQSAAASKN